MVVSFLNVVIEIEKKDLERLLGIQRNSEKEKEQ